MATPRTHSHTTVGRHRGNSTPELLLPRDMDKMRHKGAQVAAPSPDAANNKHVVHLSVMRPPANGELRNGHNNNDKSAMTDHHNNHCCPGDRLGPPEDRPPGARPDLATLDARFLYRVPGQHHHRGVPMSGLSPPSRLRELEHFAVKDDDIIVSGYPKSGTTWLQEIVYLIQHDGELALSNQTPIYMRIPYLEGHYDGMMLDSMTSPRVYKTHLPHRLLPTPVRDHRPRIIHILRSPRDTAVSYFHFYRTLTELGKFTQSWADFLEMFSAGYVCYGDWFRHTRDWWSHRHDDNVLVVTYEDMKKRPQVVIANIARFCGKDISQDTLDRIVEHTDFDNMKNNPMLNFKGVPNIDDSISTFMRKGIVGDWKNHFTVAQNETFQMLVEDQIGDVSDFPYNSKM